VEVPLGVHQISTPITAYKEGIVIKGVAVYHTTYGAATTQGSVLKWAGADCADCAVLSTGRAQSIVVRDLSIQAKGSNGEAAYALEIESAQYSQFHELDLRDGSVASMHWTTLCPSDPAPPSGRGNAYNQSSHVSIVNLEGSPVIVGSCGIGDNSHHNHLMDFRGRYRDVPFLVCGNADANNFDGFSAFKNGSVGGVYGIELKGTSEPDGRGACRHNVFSGVTQMGSQAGIVSRGNGFARGAVSNVILMWSRDNGTPAVTIEPGSTLWWSDSEGGGNH
jgi:hypothetical protein